MKKTNYAFLAAVICSMVIVTGCSDSKNDKFETTTTYEESASKDTSNESETSTINTADNNTNNNTDITLDDVTDDTTNATIDATTSNQESSSEEATTTKNNSGSNNNKNSNINNNSNNNSNNNNNNASGSSANGNVVGEKDSNKITPTYGNNSASEATKLAQAVVDKIITKGMSDFDKAKSIHDYLVVNVDYDYDNYLADTIPSDSYTVVGALKNKYAVCAGYAKAFKLMCELSGLECTYITGFAGGYHAWNQVKVDGKWYNVDVTWDDPVSTGKKFDDHKYNRYSYFLISDELMYKDHKAYSQVQTCSSSLNTKAYEVGAPWLEASHPQVKDLTTLSALAKKAVDANSHSISITWDTDWLSMADMKEMVTGALMEHALKNFSLTRYSYSSIPNTTLRSCTFEYNVSGGAYIPMEKLSTIDDIKKFIEYITYDSPDQATVAMANELVDDDIFYQVAVWAYEEHDVTIGFSETSFKVSDSAKAIHIHAFKNQYHGSHHSNEAYDATTTSEVLDILSKHHTESNSFRVIYRYGDDIGRLSATEVEEYVKNNLAPVWASEYCYKNYRISTNDFVCVMAITFSSPNHNTRDSQWEYEKEPTCIASGTSILKCADCGHITRKYDEEPTGVHDTYWVYDDGTKHLECKHCSHTGPTLYQYRDIWGYYDDNAASQLFTSINKNRETAVYYNIDPSGNLIGVETPPQLTLDNSLSQKLKDTALQAAWLYVSNGGGYNFDTNIAIIDGNFTLERAGSTLTTASSHFRNLFNNKYLTTAGVCCFHYDSDGTGLKMRTIWSIYYGE